MSQKDIVSNEQLLATAKNTIKNHLARQTTLTDEECNFLEQCNEAFADLIGGDHIKKNYCAWLFFAKTHSQNMADQTRYYALEIYFRMKCKPLLNEETSFIHEIKNIEKEASLPTTK